VRGLTSNGQPFHCLQEEFELSTTVETLEAEASSAVESATSEDEFDALAFFSGASLPEDTITVYADTATAYRLAEIVRQHEAQKLTESVEGLSLTDEVADIDPDEVEQLQTKLKTSAVIFKLRGLAPAARDAIEKKARASNPYTEGAENSEYNEDYNANLIASTIVSVSNAKGKLDKNKWDAQRVLAFAKGAQPSEFDKLYTGVFKVNFIGDAIDRAVNADFS
jgi:hypothetical protein